MELAEQIKQICKETNNEWFLAQDFTKIALYDLIWMERIENQWGVHFDDLECVCKLPDVDYCLYCNASIERWADLSEFELDTQRNCIYDYKRDDYYKSKWIVPEKIDGEIPGFMLIKLCGDSTHELVLACVRPKFRNRVVFRRV